MVFLKCQRETAVRKRSGKEKESSRLQSVRRIEAETHPGTWRRIWISIGAPSTEALEKCHYGGEGALKRETRPEPKFNALQMSQLARMIRDQTTLQLNFTFALWSCAMVRELIRREFGVTAEICP